jgi:sec-independent protein translocase protein TatA
MPSIGFGEIVVILLLALIIFGPKKLPEMGKTVGRSLREFRRATTEMKSELREGLDEAPSVRAGERAKGVPQPKSQPEPPRGEAPPT